jgi:hypothetical protein
MEFEQGLEIVDDAVFVKIGRRLTEVEIAILQHSWQGLTYEEIADATSYSVSYLKRGIGPKLWKMLTETLGEEVSKTNLRPPLERQWRQRDKEAGGIDNKKIGNTQPVSFSTASISLITPTPSTPQQDWGEAIDISTFYDRTSELATLEQWILHDGCRLITVLGIGGIGKTTLTVKLAREIVDCQETLNTPSLGKFDYIIWRSLRNAPPLATLLADLILFLSNQQDTQVGIRLSCQSKSNRSLSLLIVCCHS